jgi:uncharacterized membrane protein YphA (DoxX/SURF4 family)
MRVNPFYDSWLFLIGEDAFHLGIGPWRYLLVAIYWALAIASVYLAYRNWQADPAQRTKAHLGTWLARALIGTMWFEGCLWKLPIPSDGFKYWLEQEGKYAAWGFYQDFVTSVLLPGFTFMNIVAFLAEIGMAASFMLGFGVRAVALFGMIYAAQLYIGLYRNPSEWPWEYVFIIVINWLFYIHAAGRSLGLDALLRRETTLGKSDGILARLYRWAS